MRSTTTILKRIRKFLAVNWCKTIYVNFKLLPLSKAKKLPIYIRRNVKLVAMEGIIDIVSSVRPGMITFGGGPVMIFDQRTNRTLIELHGKLKFLGTAHFGKGSVLSVGPNGYCEIGDQFSISAASKIVCFNKVILKEKVLLSWDILILDSDFHSTINTKTNIINDNISKPIIIGDNSWIGNSSIILKGTIIPNNTVVGAMSLLNKDYSEFPENSLLAGNPATIKAVNIRLYRD